jgi:hypothetical protein
MAHVPLARHVRPGAQLQDVHFCVSGLQNSPAGQLVEVQAQDPFWHSWLAAQTLPHVPQLSWSLWKVDGTVHLP